VTCPKCGSAEWRFARLMYTQRLTDGTMGGGIGDVVTALLFVLLVGSAGWAFLSRDPFWIVTGVGCLIAVIVSYTNAFVRHERAMGNLSKTAVCQRCGTT